MEWGEVYLSQMRRPYLETCARCQEGELFEGEYCLRDIPGSNGQCPIADTGPKLLPTNQISVEIFQELQGSCSQVVAEDKTYIYIDLCAADVLMRLHGIEEADRLGIMQKLLLLQDVSNNKRRPRPRQVTRPKRG